MKVWFTNKGHYFFYNPSLGVQLPNCVNFYNKYVCIYHTRFMHFDSITDA